MMPGRSEPRFAAVLLALTVAGILAISGCGGGGEGGSISSSTVATDATDATDAPTQALRPSNPYATLGKCESLYERVYASTARKVAELSAAGSELTPGERRELSAARTKHGQALQYCEEEIEIDQVHGRRLIDIAATCGQPESAVEKLRGELTAPRLRDFDRRRPVVCARVE